MRQQLTVILIVLLVLSSCTIQTEESLTDLNFSSEKKFEGNASDTCFDVQMDVWMEKFQHFQQTGSDMFSADLKARDASLQAYRDCQNRQSKAIVDNEARKD